MDNDCDGIRDNGFDDLDLDGWADGCGDCDDSDATVNPGQIEVCGDSFDNDCDGLFDWADTLTCNVDTVLPASWYGCGGGCDQSGVPAGGIAGVLAGLLVIRRRRT